MSVRRPSRLLLPAIALALAVLATAAATPAAPPPSGPNVQGEEQSLPNVDARKGRKAPTQAQLARVKPGSEARFNRFGAPEILADPGAYLATGLSTDDVAAARAYLRANRELIGLSEAEVDDLELLNAPAIGSGSAVLLRQRFGDLPAGRDGLVTVGVVDGKIAFVSSSLATDTRLTGAVDLAAEDAVRAAAEAAGHPAGAISNVRSEDGWTVMDVAGYTDPARARLVGVPTPTEGVRQAYEVLLMDVVAESPLGAMSYVDAANGDLLVRDGIVQHAADNPAWKAFPASPPLDYSTTDTRELWCWSATAPPAGCQKAVANASSPAPWDVDAATDTPWFLTRGNNARATEKWNTNQGSAQGVNYAASATRDYVYPWTNQWYESRCNPASFTSLQLNDIDAARANLHAMHNRMHDWAYVLGFTETTFNAQAFNFGKGGAQGDPEHGNAQAGGIVGGPPGFASRDNANQFSGPDGVVPVTNMFLWQPIPGAFYSPCVDGDYDMSVIGHEYTHLISNRMVAGPNANLSGNQAGAMGESWSDLAAAEFLNSQALVPLADENPFAVGPYVTGDRQAGIRNYGMNRSPLNYSDVGYDFACNQGGTCTQRTQVHADGEIWSATNYDLRQAFVAAYDGSFPAGDIGLQQACVAGDVPVTQCPGNRRWMQLVFDAWLLMASGSVSMVDARDAMLAADLVRFGGANQALLWNAFARRGLGSGASSAGSAAFDPTPSFESPHANNATVTFKAVGDADGHAVQLFVGRYEAAATPIADTDPATALGDTFKIVPGTFEFVARGDGFGTQRFTFSFDPGQVRDLPVNMSRNVASAASGATATGDGVNLDKLIDDTEATDWASLTGAVAGKQVTVRLDPSQASHQVRRVQVSAMLRVNTGDANDPGGQNRFTALRSFELWTCEAKGAVDCSQDSQFTRIFTSPDDAFPSGVPRPRAPELIMRSFDVPQTKATHVRLRVLTNQCTGAPAYQGDQDDDPGNSPDCDDTTLPGFGVNATRVRAAELQVFEH
ncbi:MAG TPA: M36 family metallopeptidase [Gaiellaceae bacterium]|nr:M36 family metallopeptidase [Gaiellaceae bacterium]